MVTQSASLLVAVIVLVQSSFGVQAEREVTTRGHLRGNSATVTATNENAATLGAGEECLPKGGDCLFGKKKCCSGWCITPAGSTDGKPMCADAPATLTNMAPDVLYVENRTLLKGATLGAGEECLPKGGDCLFGKKSAAAVGALPLQGPLTANRCAHRFRNDPALPTGRPTRL